MFLNKITHRLMSTKSSPNIWDEKGWFFLAFGFYDTSCWYISRKFANVLNIHMQNYVNNGVNITEFYGNRYYVLNTRMLELLVRLEPEKKLSGTSADKHYLMLKTVPDVKIRVSIRLYDAIGRLQEANSVK